MNQEINYSINGKYPYVYNYEPEEDLSQNDDFKIWLMLAGYEASHSNLYNEDLQFNYKQSIHVQQLNSDFDDCFSFGDDDPFETDQQTRERAIKEKQKAEDLENEFIVWKLQNWEMFLKNGWYGDFELWYQFITQKEKESITK